jgi:hypothetical protein
MQLHLLIKKSDYNDEWKVQLDDFENDLSISR